MSPTPPPLPDRFTTNPASPFPAGTTVSVCFSNPGLAGQTISVTVLLGSGSSETLSITLDGEGHGCRSWVAPVVDTAIFQHTTSADHAVVIT